MLKIPISDDEWVELDEDDKLDYLCDWFEQALKNGEQPTLVDYLSRIDTSRHNELLRELMQLEQSYREGSTKSSDATLSTDRSRHDTDFKLEGSTNSMRRSLGNVESQYPIPFGRYILQSYLGCGAFGDVFLSENISTGKRFAIKVPRTHIIGDQSDIALFVREARNAGKLDHANIVRVFDQGTYGNTPFLVSEYVHGVTLKQLIAEQGRLPLRAAVRLIADLGRALQHAHERQVIHRDLKPSNVMIEFPYGTNSIDIHNDPLNPKLLDFGISKLTNSNTLATLPGEILGTPVYMSPEQAGGKSSELTPLSDVYSLGALLFELLVGRTPFEGSTTVVLHNLAHSVAPRLDSIDRSIPKELGIICNKALQADPASRYASALSFSEDLERWLDGRPILTQASKPITRMWCWMRQHTKELTWSTVAACLVLAIVLLAWRLLPNPSGSQKPMGFLSPDISNQSLRTAFELEEWLDRLPASADHPEVLLREMELPIAPERIRYLGEALKPAESSIAPVLEREFADNAHSRTKRAMLAAVRLALDPQKLDVASWEGCPVLVDWLFSNDLGREEVAWFEFLKPSATGFLPFVCDQLIGDLPSEKREKALRLVGASLDSTTIEIVLEAAAQCRLDELTAWSGIFRPQRAASISAIRNYFAASEPALTKDGPGELVAQKLGRLITIAYSLGGIDEARPLVAMSRDPRPNFYFAVALHACELPADAIIAQLPQEKDPNVLYVWMRALLAGACVDRHTTKLQEQTEWLSRAYAEHPDAGIHESTRCLLEKLDEQDAINEIDQQLSHLGYRPGFEWYVNSIGMSMRIFRGPVDYHFRETKREGPGVPYLTKSSDRTIPHSFAISQREVPKDVYAQFDSHFEPRVPTVDSLFPTIELTPRPAAGFRFSDTVGFCEWLSQREGIAAADAQVATKIDDSQDKSFPTIYYDVDIGKVGYRLPTSHEWHAFIDSDIASMLKEDAYLQRRLWLQQALDESMFDLLFFQLPLRSGMSGASLPREWTCVSASGSGVEPNLSQNTWRLSSRRAQAICGFSDFENKAVLMLLGMQETPGEPTSFRLCRTFNSESDLVPFQTKSPSVKP